MASEVVETGPAGAFVVPRAIAVAGASDLSGGNYYGARVLANLVEGRASAKIYPINPRLAGMQLFGLPVYKSLADLPSCPDLLFVVTPIDFVVPSLEEAARMGIATSVVVTAESGSEAERQAFRQKIADLSRSSRMRIIGPNSMGIMNGSLSLNGSFASGTVGGRVPPGDIACLSQSGATLSAMLQWFGESRVGFSWLISTGDESATGIEELMQAMVDDPDVKSIMLFLEGVSDGEAFRRAALAASLAGKPVTMLQVGKSDKGREAVQSHTGRVAGTKEVFDAIARETSIIETESFLEFFGTARTMAQYPPGKFDRRSARRAAVVTVSGGAASLGADQLRSLGWMIPELSDSTVAAVLEKAAHPGVHNPADIGGAWRNPQKMTRAITAIAADERIDTIFLSMGAGGLFAKDVALAIAEAAKGIEQDVFVSWIGMSEDVRAVFDEADIPVFDDFPLAVRAAEALARFSEGQRHREEAIDLMRALDTKAGRAAGSTATKPGLWTVTEALHDLRDAGLPCAGFDVATGLDVRDIADRAEKIGFPVVLKLSSVDLNHKSDDGGVAIRLADRKAVETAAERFCTIAAKKQLRDPSVLIQQMASGVELLVGIKRDPSFGPILVVGLGGTLAELHAEVAAAILPTTRSTVKKILSQNHRLSMLLDGYRGQPAADRDALVNFLSEFAEWALAKGERLEEVDLNPIMVSGNRISIVDARAVWG